MCYNERNYPLLTQLFEILEVETQASEMAFSVSLDNGALEWCGTGLKGVFAQKRNILSLSFLKMLREIFKFNEQAAADLDNGKLKNLTLIEYLEKANFSDRLKNDYLVPMTAAIWSTPAKEMLEFPAESLINFMKNHSLMQSDRPKWRTITGGSREYVKKLNEATNAEIRVNCGLKMLHAAMTASKLLIATINYRVLTRLFLQRILIRHAVSLKIRLNWKKKS